MKSDNHTDNTHMPAAENWSAFASWLLLLTFLLIGWIAGVTHLSASELPDRLRFDRYTIEDGLSQSVVNTVHQDNEGFIWVGTQDGLNRFDGYEFKVFKHIHDDPTSIADNYINCIYLDRQDRLWVGTDKGLSRYDKKTNRFINYTSDEEGERHFPGRVVQAIFQDSKGTLWIGSDVGLHRFDEFGELTFRTFSHKKNDPRSLSDNTIFSLAEFQNDLWIGTANCLNRMVSDVRFDRICAEDGLPSSKIHSLMVENDDRLWVGTLAGIALMRPGKQPVVYATDKGARLGSDRVTSIKKDASGRIWIATDQGLSRFVESSQNFVTYKSQFNNPVGLSASDIYSLFVDRQGLLWIGTYGGGLNVWNPLTAQFGHYLTLADIADAGGSNSVFGLYMDQQEAVWIGTNGGGVYRYQLGSGKIQRFSNEPENGSTVSTDFVTAITGDYANNIWLGSYFGLNLRPKGETRFYRFIHDDTEPDTISHNLVTAVYEDHSGQLWVGSFGGLDRVKKVYDESGRLRPEKIVFERWIDKLPSSFVSRSSVVYAIYEDLKGNFWVGGDAGLLLYQKDSDKFFEFTHSRDNPRSLSHNGVQVIFEDYQGTVWVGTADGLNKIVMPDDNPELIYFDRYTEEDGLPNDAVYSILGNKSGELWLGTGGGLVKFFPSEESFITFTARDGLQSDEFNNGAAYLARDGRMLFGGINGFNVFQPEGIKLKTMDAPLVLTGVQLLNKKIPIPESYHQTQRIALSKTHPMVTFEVAALDYASADHKRYRYQLQGLSDEWVELGQQRSITLTNLDVGRYQLRVQASTRQGIWSPSILSVDLRVQQSFWRSPTAIGLYAALLSAVLLTLLWLWRRHFIHRIHDERGRFWNAIKETKEVQTQLTAAKEDTRQALALLAEKDREIQQLNQQLDDLRLTDLLTGLRNRRYLSLNLEQTIQQLNQQWASYYLDQSMEDRVELGFLLIDLDGFRLINESYGHDSGDHVISQVADVLRQACYGADTLVRWNDEAFLVIRRKAVTEDSALLAERIRKLIATRPFDLGNGSKVELTCSIGYSHYPFVRSQPELMTWEQVIDIADQALYIAKRNSRNAWLGLVASEYIDYPGVLDMIQTDLATLIERGDIEFSTSIPSMQTINWNF